MGVFTQVTCNIKGFARLRILCERGLTPGVFAEASCVTSWTCSAQLHKSIAMFLEKNFGTDHNHCRFHAGQANKCELPSWEKPHQFYPVGAELRKLLPWGSLGQRHVSDDASTISIPSLKLNSALCKESKAAADKWILYGSVEGMFLPARSTRKWNYSTLLGDSLTTSTRNRKCFVLLCRVKVHGEAKQTMRIEWERHHDLWHRDEMPPAQLKAHTAFTSALFWKWTDN